MSEYREYTNISTDFTSDFFIAPKDAFSGISIVHSGAGYTFDLIIEVSNSWNNALTWTERPDTLLTTLDPTDTPISIDFQTGMSVFRIKLTNVVNTISTLVIDVHKL
jgi:hypothetical protein